MARLWNSEETNFEHLSIVSIQPSKQGVLIKLRDGRALKLDAFEAGKIAHTFLGTTRIKRCITGGIVDTIKTHGPIEKGLVSSASDRIFGGLLGLSKSLGRSLTFNEIAEEENGAQNNVPKNKEQTI